MINAISFYRVANWLYRHHIPLLPPFITLLIFLIYNSKIPHQATIGKGTICGYGGIGVVVHKKTVIGRNCMIGQQVTLGGGNSRYPGVPTVGDNVYMAKGAIIFGGITVGDNATIGANAVVNIPVPAGGVAAGVPAKIIKVKSDEKGDHQ